MKPRFLCGIGFAILLYWKCPAQENPTPLITKQAYLCWNSAASSGDSVDQESYANALMAMGFSFTRTDIQGLRSVPNDSLALVVIPFSSAKLLSGAQIAAVLEKVENGLRLITDGPSRIAAALNISPGSPVRVSKLIDRLLPEVRFHWSDQPEVPWLKSFPHSLSKVLYADSASGKALGLSLRHGKGQIIYLAALFDSISGQGYARFPTLGHAIVEELKCRPMFKRNGIDAYFDAGYRFNLPIEKLAAMWHQWGIRAVHAAAWYGYSTPPYDYRRLIRAAHENGIRVYAWLEWPHVGVGFWNQHPEWRQKNALLGDAKLDFLHLMDLQNPECLKTAMGDLAILLKEDWDGVDIAEFTITGAGGEALAGPTRPDYFVSFGTPARTEFKQLAGFDPLELEDSTSRHYWVRDTAALDQFYRYRTNVNNRLLRQVVEFVAHIKTAGKRDWELIHTIVDNSLHPEFDYLLGFDFASTIQLLKEFNVTLNVEDPYMEWSQPPNRYQRLRSSLTKILPGRNSMIDINVVPIHPESQPGFATAQATGIELLQQIRSASEQQGRVCLYCESSVFRHDWELVPHALSAGTTAKRVGSAWNIDGPNTVLLGTGETPADVTLDGKPWPAIGGEEVIVPAGKHRISFESASLTASPGSDLLRLTGISDELLDCSMINAGIELTYESPARCLISLNKYPVRFRVDGAPVNLQVLAVQASFIVIAPSGRHRLFISMQ
jgi:hypothetical protein